jgi:hypothetical protein
MSMRSLVLSTIAVGASATLALALAGSKRRLAPDLP